MKTRKQDWKQLISPALCLLILCLALTFFMAFTHALTADRIAEQRELALSRSMSRLIAAERYEVVLEEDGNPLIFAAVLADGTYAGYLVLTNAFGYSGNIFVVTGIQNGTILAVEIVDANAETPGLGQNVLSETFTRQSQNLTEPPTLIRGVPTASGQIQALTGATISSDAVVRAVAEAMELYRIHIGQGG